MQMKKSTMRNKQAKDDVVQAFDTIKYLKEIIHMAIETANEYLKVSVKEAAIANQIINQSLTKRKNLQNALEDALNIINKIDVSNYTKEESSWMELVMAICAMLKIVGSNVSEAKAFPCKIGIGFHHFRQDMEVESWVDKRFHKFLDNFRVFENELKAYNPETTSQLDTRLQDSILKHLRVGKKTPGEIEEGIDSLVKLTEVVCVRELRNEMISKKNALELLKRNISTARELIEVCYRKEEETLKKEVLALSKGLITTRIAYLFPSDNQVMHGVEMGEPTVTEDVKLPTVKVGELVGTQAHMHVQVSLID